MKIGKVIKDLIKEKGITQIELAKRLNVSKQRVETIVNDKASPSIKTVEDVASCLGVKVSQLVKRAEKEN